MTQFERPVTLGAIAAFQRDLMLVKSKLGLLTNVPKPDRPFRGDGSMFQRGEIIEQKKTDDLGSDDDWRTRLENFLDDLQRIATRVPVFVEDRVQAAATAPSDTAPVFDRDTLNTLHSQLLGVLTDIRAKADARRDQLLQAWPDDPRLCTGSVLGPLSIRNKEVPLTQALAWLMTPRHDSPIHAALLAAMSTLILRCDVSVSDTTRWSVASEEHVRDDEDWGRIDIYIEGTVGPQLFQIAIEAKVNAPEGDRQLHRYQEMLAKRSQKLESEHRGKLHIVFLTPAGRVSKTLESATTITYADLLKQWIPVLRAHPDSHAAPFARLLMADMARDLADMHLGNHLSGRGTSLPKYVDDDPTNLSTRRRNA